MKLTRADKYAIQNQDSDYLLNKGVHYYNEQDYEVAVEYYHLASAIGNARAVCNLGYCYMYGRGLPADTSLSLSYFRISADQREVEALYKLGKLYCTGFGVEMDKELGVYYYENALEELRENYTPMEYLDYPALFHAMAMEMLPEGGMKEDLKEAYKYLLIASMGYAYAIEKGAAYYRDANEEVGEKMDDPMFDDVREKARKEFEEEFLAN